MKNKIRPTMYRALSTFGSRFALLPTTIIMIPTIINIIDAPNANILFQFMVIANPKHENY